MQEMKNNEDKEEEEEAEERKDIVNDDSKSTKQEEDQSNSLLRCCGENKEGGTFSNLYTFHGPLEDFHESYDVAVALHLCGEATDVCIRKSIQNKVKSMIVAPCCVGKLSQKSVNPDIFNATGQNSSAVLYPQSTLFCQVIRSNRNSQRAHDDWDALAKAADYSNEQEFGTSRNATQRTAKALLETDRRLFLEEQHYCTALLRMEPMDVTPKNDILVAWRHDETFCAGSVKDSFSIPSSTSQADVEFAKEHLFLNKSEEASDQPEKFINDHNDWTREEERDIECTISEFLDRTKEMEDQVHIFPTRMGRRKRKLIHFVAEKLDLTHWSYGSKDSEKTVAIARKRKQQAVVENNETSRTR
jgi:hypothetical protein